MPPVSPGITINNASKSLDIAVLKNTTPSQGVSVSLGDSSGTDAFVVLNSSSTLEFSVSSNGNVYIPSLTSGQVVFAEAGGLLTDSANLIWDNTNARLGIGSNATTPTLPTLGGLFSYPLDIYQDSNTGPTISITNPNTGTLASSTILFAEDSTLATKNFNLGWNNTNANFGAAPLNGPRAYLTSSGAMSLFSGVFDGSGDMLFATAGFDTANVRLKITYAGSIVNTLGDASGANTFTVKDSTNATRFSVGSSGAVSVPSLTASRITYAGTSGLLQDSANLTFDGTNLTANSIKDSALTSGRVTYAGASGLLTDSASLTFDGTGVLALSSSQGYPGHHLKIINTADQYSILRLGRDDNANCANIFYVGSATGSSGLEPLNSLVVHAQTSATGGISVYASASGAPIIMGTNSTERFKLDGSGNALFTLGDSAGTDTFRINASNASLAFSVDSSAHVTVPSLTSGRVTYAGASGLLRDSSNLTFDGTNLTVSGNIVPSILSGTGALSTGTATITATITASSKIMVTYNTQSGGSYGLLVVPDASRIVGTSFVVNSVDLGGSLVTGDNSTFDWVVIG